MIAHINLGLIVIMFKNNPRFQKSIPLLLIVAAFTLFYRAEILNYGYKTFHRELASPNELNNKNSA
jgi:hypothetical protein